MTKTAQKEADSLIAENRKARYEFFIEEHLEAGLSLMGWEVKSMRAGRVQLSESYVVVSHGECFLVGAHITPLASASTHVITAPTRQRKLLMHRGEIDRLVGAVERDGYTLIPLELYWKGSRAKLKVGLAKGKKQHDKRATEKNRDWQRDKARLMRTR
jgi:SsrA-binding protein